MNESRQETISILVARCLALREDGSEEIRFDEVCADHPELEDDVRKGVEIAGRIPALGVSLAEVDPRLGGMLAGRYRLDARIGQGAMGSVYRGRDLDFDRDVAVKVVHTGLIDESRAYARFDREAAVLARLRHPSIVTVHDRGVTEEGAPFLVMEEVSGVSCADMLDHAESRQGDRTDWLVEQLDFESVAEPSYFRQCARWMLAIAEAVHAAHEQGIQHRDIKPSNILLRTTGEPILIDFGIAAAKSDVTLTEAGSAVGTPAYMAPEVLSGRTRDEAKRDIYGIAATLYHLWTRRPPFRGSPTEVLAALATREPEPAFRVRPGLPRDAQAILDKGLARNPDSRYESAAALADDLRAFLEFRPVKARATSTVVRVGRRLVRSRTVLGAGAATLVLLVALTAFSIRQSRARARFDDFRLAYLRIPANTGIVSPANRPVADAVRRLEAEAAFDAVVATGGEPVTAHLLRGMFHRDHGDEASAERDLRALARHAGTAYTAAVAETDPVAAGDAIEPEPKTADDFHVAAFLAIRQGRIDDAVTLLDDPRLSDRRHAQELRLVLRTIPLAKLDQAGDWDGLFVESQRLIEDVLALEGRLGGRSATTAHLLGSACLRQQRDGDALRFADEAAALAPASHVALLNAGKAAYHMGRFDEAEVRLRAALAISPDYVKIEQVLAKVEAIRGRAESARSIVESAHFAGTKLGIRQRAILGARVEIDLAIECHGDDTERCRDAVARALVHCEHLSTKSVTRVRAERYAAALVGGDAAALTVAILDDLADDPLSEPLLGALVEHGRLDGSAAQQVALQRWLDHLAERVQRSANASPDGPVTDVLHQRR